VALGEPAAEERGDDGGERAGRHERELGGAGLPALLERPGLRRDAFQARERILDPDRQGGEHRRHPVPEREPLVVAADAHRDERSQPEPVGRDAAAREVAAERARDDREHDVVHLAGRCTAHGEEVVQGKLGPHDVPGVGQPAVEGERWCRLAHERGEDGDGLDRLPRSGPQPPGAEGGSDAGQGDPPPAEPRGEGDGGAGRPARRGRWGGCHPGARVGDHIEDLRAAHAVEHGVMDLEEERGPPALEPLDQVHLPEGVDGIEGRREEGVDQPVQLRLAARRGHRDPAHVAVHVEGRVPRPGGEAQIEHRPDRSLVVAAERAEPLLEGLGKAVERDGPLQDSHATDVQELVPALELEEGGVERGEPSRLGHDAPPQPARRRSRAGTSR
jgi:hypothetical protein